MKRGEGGRTGQRMQPSGGSHLVGSLSLLGVQKLGLPFRNGLYWGEGGGLSCQHSSQSQMGCLHLGPGASPGMRQSP